MKKSYIPVLVIFLVLLFDQWLKIWVKLNIPYGTGFNMLGLSWAKIHFIENPGMAFGLELGGVTGKLILSTFRIALVGVLIYILRQMIKAKESLGLVISFSLIIAGAIGNIIDSVFYGMIFSSAYHGGVAQFMPPEGGYAPILQGKVVDMFYFPLFKVNLPEWLPIWGGKPFEFFKPIFNIADSAITVGVASIILFHRKFFSAKKEEQKVHKSSEENTTTEGTESSESTENNNPQEDK